MSYTVEDVWRERYEADPIGTLIALAKQADCVEGRRRMASSLGEEIDRRGEDDSES